VAVTETVKLAGNVLQGVLMVRVEVADPPDVNVTLVGFRLAVMLEDDGVAVRLRVPENMFRLVRVIVDVAEVPAEKVTDDGLVDIVKSLTLTSASAECDSAGAPLVPVTVMVNVLGDGAAVQLTVSTELPEPPEILVELRVAVQPPGAAEADNVTVPVNGPIGDTVIVDMAAEPTPKLTDVGFAVRLKSILTTLTDTVAV